MAGTGGSVYPGPVCPLGSFVWTRAECWEPYELRGSRTVLGARGGEIPPRDSLSVVPAGGDAGAGSGSGDRARDAGRLGAAGGRVAATDCGSHAPGFIAGLVFTGR